MRITVPVVGVNFRPSEARDTVRNAAIGDEVTLEAEPYNQYDSNAVKVLLDGEHIGYVPKTDNSALAAALEDGAEPYAEIVAFESTLRPLIEIEWE